MNIFSEIKTVWNIKTEVSKMSISELKTSEGRLTLLTNIVAIYASVQGFIPAALSAKIAIFSVTAYTIARAIVKAAQEIAKLTVNTKDDAIVDEASKALDIVAPKS
jgi:hypothetical protein